MKNERTVYTTRGCFPFILVSSCNRKNENGYNWSYFYFSFFVWGLEKRKRMLSYPFSILYYEIEKRKTKGRYIHGPGYSNELPILICLVWQLISIWHGMGVSKIYQTRSQDHSGLCVNQNDFYPKRYWKILCNSLILSHLHSVVFQIIWKRLIQNYNENCVIENCYHLTKLNKDLHN